MSDRDTIISKLKRANQLYSEEKYAEAAKLYQELLTQNQKVNIQLAHSLILSIDWEQVSRLLPKGINYLDYSGWINSVKTGKPVDKQNRPVPWYTYPTIEFIEDKIRKEFQVFEFGAGNSTFWFAQRVKNVISIESDPDWFSYIRSSLPHNVEINLIENAQEYPAQILNYPDFFFDIIVVDGINRNQCAKYAANKLKENGFIIFDNTDNHAYDEGNQYLLKEEFKRIDFYGLIPSYTYKNCTSIFFRDTSLLSRGLLPSEKQSCLGKACFQITNPKKNQNQIPDVSSIKLNKINFVIFPDWEQQEEVIAQDLTNVFKQVFRYSYSNFITLLIDIPSGREEETELILSGVIMNLFMEEQEELSDRVEIKSISNIDIKKWKVISPAIQGRIILQNENKEKIVKLGGNELTSWKPQMLHNLNSEDSKKCN